MNILISNDGYSAHYFIRQGWARAMKYCGHNVQIWNIHKKPVFDAFDETKPDLFIGQTYNVTKSWIKCIEENPQCHVIMKASDWGNISDTIDTNRYPVLIANSEEVELLRELKHKTGKPDYLYVHYIEPRLKETHTHWIDAGFRMESMLSGADIFEFCGGKYKEEYASDVAFIGGRWGYKSNTIDKWVLPLSRYFHVKIFGNSDWGIPEYCGMAQPGEFKHITASAKVCINISEPHSQDLGYDIVERPFKLLSNKCVVVSDYVEDMHTLFPSHIKYGRNPKEYVDKIRECIKDNKPNEDGYKEVMEKHTYFHRVSHMFNKLGLTNKSKDMIKGFNNYYEQFLLKESGTRN